ncbi:hypothetical protein, partial [Terrihalobacillus insolitus]|uniref:hypothetical protein n=1 Tax=Terrihalobacillus insolitus TaxID=2950438 RepID=UPI002FEE31AF
MDDTILYLEEKGYETDTDIEEMSIANIGADEEMNAVVVTFKDEPEAAYFYTYDKGTNQIIQMDVV